MRLLLVLAFTAIAFAQPVPFEADGAWGYRTPQGKILIPAQYASAGPFSRTGIALVCDRDGWAYIDDRGRILIRPFPFDNGPDDFHQDLARFTEKEKFGYFNTRAAIVIPAKFVSGL